LTRPDPEELFIVLARAEGPITPIQIRGRLRERGVEWEQIRVDAVLLVLRTSGWVAGGDRNKYFLSRRAHERFGENPAVVRWDCIPSPFLEIPHAS
jgi:hypothetical protein